MALPVTINLADPNGAAINGIPVYFYDMNEVLVGQATTVAGSAVVSLDGTPDPGTEYIIRLWAPTYKITDGSTQTIKVIEPLVGGTNIFNLVGTLIVLKASIDPEMCTLTGYFTDASMRPVPGLVLNFQPVAGFYEDMVTTSMATPGTPAIIRNRMVTRPSRVKTGPDGYTTLELPRGGIYEVLVEGFEHPLTGTERINVPDAASALLEDVLFPYVSTVVYSMDPATVAIGATVDITLTVTLSDTRILSTLAEAQQLLAFTSSDEAVATINLADDVLTITGIAAGSATIAVERIAKTFAAHEPSLAAPNAGLVVTVT